VPRLAVIQLTLDQGGEDIEVTRPATYLPGKHEIEWTVPDVPSGSYDLQAVFTDGIDIVRTAVRKVRISGGTPAPTPSPSPSPSTAPPAALPAGRSGPGPILPVAAGIALAGGVALLVFLRRRRRPPATIPGDGSGV
jgi:LPXTG-motif cell wall-anchored protein